MPWLRPLEPLWQDLRHGARLFARNPALTAICIVSIAFGTGANVAIFSMVDALLTRPLPVRRPAEIVTVGSRVLQGTIYRNAASYPDYLDIRSRARSFSGLAALGVDLVGFGTRKGDPPRVRFATFVSDNYFSALGVDLQLGRGFRPDEAGPGGRGTVVVLGDALWRSDFDQDPAVLGRHLRVAGKEFTVVGVAPASYTGMHPYIKDTLYLPIGMLPYVTDSIRRDVLDMRDRRLFTLKGRLAPGVTLAQAQAEVATIGRALEQAYPETNTNLAFITQSEFDYRYEARPLDSATMVILTILSIAVLCVACANVAGLLASRAPVRARELALRLAVGASRGRLVRQLVTETAGIAVAGALGGLFVGRVGIALLHQIRFPTELVSPPVFDLDARTLLFSIAVAVVTAFAVGLGPAVQMTRVDLAASLKTADRGAAEGHRLAGRSGLVALQVALSLVLLTMAVFTVQVVSYEMTAGPGFRTTHVAKVTVQPGQAGYGDPDTRRFFETLSAQTRALPGVSSVAVTSAMPLFNFQFTPVLPEGYQLPKGQKGTPVWSSSISEDYFKTLDVPVLEGRTFTIHDDESGAAVAIVNDTLARHYWPGGGAIGKRMRILDPPGGIVEIIGVMKTTVYGYPGEVPQEAIYFPFRQRPHGQMVLLARVAGDSASMVQPLRDLVRRLDPDVPILDAQTIEAFWETRVSSFGTTMVRLVGGMGLMGLGLTMVGLYGLVSYNVNRRTREIGIRIAVGATCARVVRMVLRQGMAPAWIGLASGLLLSVATARLMAQMVPFDRHVDERTYYVVVPLVAAVTLAAAFLPARRAARVDPTVALRAE